jgi:hypothetical protein
VTAVHLLLLSGRLQTEMSTLARLLLADLCLLLLLLTSSRCCCGGSGCSHADRTGKSERNFGRFRLV